MDTKTDTLYFRQNLSSKSIEDMKRVRKMTIALSQEIESLSLTSSRELSLAFTHLETALMYAIKHICLVDPQATIETLD